MASMPNALGWVIIVLATVCITLLGVVYVADQHNSSQYFDLTLPPQAPELERTALMGVIALPPQRHELFRFSGRVSAKPRRYVVAEAEVEAIAEAMYFEAYHEDPLDAEFIAHVILNRVASPLFPDTAPRVVNQGIEKGLLKCQFTYKCDGKSETIQDQELFAHYKEIVRKLLLAELRKTRSDPTGGSLYYHNPWVGYRADGSSARTVVAQIPGWVAKGGCQLTLESGQHHYYAPREEHRLC